MCLNMADQANVSSESACKQPKSEHYDPSLDFFSDKFDPLKALNTPGLVPPVASARAFDNLSSYNSACKQKSADGTPKADKLPVEPAKIPERRWLPHQLPVKATPKKRKNILTRIEDMTGPLAILTKCMRERFKVKVWTRNAAGIRGYCIGFVTAFDKHWNLCLEDVTEVWTRTKHRKIPPLQGQVEEDRKSSNRILLPPVKILKSDKKTETCERHVPQWMVRGEQIVFISITNLNEPDESRK